MMKKFQVRQNHQLTLNKRIVDQLREVQQLELRQAKERFDAEVRTIEALGTFKIKNRQAKDELSDAQTIELNIEKERILAKSEAEKVAALEASHAKALKRLQQEHRIAIRQIKIQHDLR